MAFHPLYVPRAVESELETFVFQAGDGYVAFHASGFVQHERVRHLARRTVDLARGEMLQELHRARPRDLGAFERRHVVEGDTLAGGAGLGGCYLGPVPPGPLTTSETIVLAVEQLLVRLEPLRAFPPRCFEEIRAQILLPRIVRAGTQRAWLFHRLLGVDDVVDLAEGLRGAGQNVGRAPGEGLEAMNVGPGRVYARDAVGKPLGHHLAHADSVRDPDRLRDPEPSGLPRLAEQRPAIRRKREQPVHGTGHPGVFERGDHLPRLLPGRLEVLRGELEHRRELALAPVVAPDVVGGDGHGTVPVGSDAEVIFPLTHVHGEVLVAQHGLHDLPRLARQLGERRGPRELVLHRHERHGHPDHAPDVRPPHPGAADDQLRLDASPVRLHGPDPAVLHLDAGYLGLAVELHAALRS